MMKKYILLREDEVSNIEKQAEEKLLSNIDKPLSESTIEAKSVLDVIKWIRENNIYERNLPSDNRIN